METERLHIRHCLLHYFRAGKDSTDTTRIVCSIEGEFAVSEKVCRNWFNRFRAGDIDLNDKPRSGRPHKVDDGKLKALLRQNSALSSRQLSARLGVSHTTVLTRMHVLEKMLKEEVGEDDCAEKRNILPFQPNNEGSYSCIVCGDSYPEFDYFVPVPERPTARQVWSKSLGVDFLSLLPSVDLLVCKEHFAPKDFVSNTETKLANLRAFRHLTLHRWAIPGQERQLSKLLAGEMKNKTMPSAAEIASDPQPSTSAYEDTTVVHLTSPAGFVVNNHVDSPDVTASEPTAPPDISLMGQPRSRAAAKRSRWKLNRASRTKTICSILRRTRMQKAQAARKARLSNPARGVESSTWTMKKKIRAPSVFHTAETLQPVEQSSTGGMEASDVDTHSDARPEYESVAVDLGTVWHGQAQCETILLQGVKEEILDEASEADFATDEALVEFNLDDSPMRDDIESVNDCEEEHGSGTCTIPDLQLGISQNIRGDGRFYLVSEQSLLRLFEKCTICNSPTSTKAITQKGLGCVAKINCPKGHGPFLWSSERCGSLASIGQLSERENSQEMAWHLYLISLVAGRVKISPEELATFLGMIFNAPTLLKSIEISNVLISNVPLIHTLSNCSWSTRITSSMAAVIVSKRVLILMDRQTYVPAACIDVPGITMWTTAQISNLLATAVLRLHILGIHSLNEIHLLLPSCMRCSTDDWKPLLVNDARQMHKNAVHRLKALLPFYKNQGLGGQTPHNIIEETVKVILFFQPLLNAMPEPEARETLTLLLKELLQIRDAVRFTPSLIDLAVARVKLTVLRDPRFSEKIRAIFAMFDGLDVLGAMKSVYCQSLDEVFNQQPTDWRAVTVIPTFQHCEPVSKAMQMAELLANEQYSIANVLSVIFLLPTE